MTDDRYADVTRTVERYFDGLYYGDLARLSDVFHPAAHYVSATEPPMVHLTMPEYFALVEKRPPPASRHEGRCEVIEAIELAGHATAFVRARCVIRPKRFTDFLTLVLVAGRWQIISKVFHYVSQ